MAKFRVTFTQYWFYEVDAENEDDAVNEAYIKFNGDVKYPVARTQYDDVEVESIDEEGDYIA